MSGKTKRYCIDCGAFLVYYANLSNPKAPNEHRNLVYGCPKCTESFEKPKLFSIHRSKVSDPLVTIHIEIIQQKL